VLLIIVKNVQLMQPYPNTGMPNDIVLAWVGLVVCVVEDQILTHHTMQREYCISTV